MSHYHADDFCIENIVNKKTKPSHPIRQFQHLVAVAFRKISHCLFKLACAILFVLYTIYLGFAINHCLQGAISLIVISSIVILFFAYYTFKKHLGPSTVRVLSPLVLWITKQKSIKYFLLCVVAIIFVWYAILSVVRSVRQVQSLFGLVLIVTSVWLTSKIPEHIKWWPVITGFISQWILALIVLRSSLGYNIAKFLSDSINRFLGFSLAGAAAVFGDPFFIFHPFIMMIIPLIIYIGGVLGILYHTGILQLVLRKWGWLVHVLYRISAVEALAILSSIFLSALESMILLRMIIDKMTGSEFFTFLVGAHSTISGFAFSLFTVFGVNGQHLLTGAFMSAPAAIALAKLSYPETEESQFNDIDNFKFPESNDMNAGVACANGAYAAAKNGLSIVVNVIMFLSLYKFVNTGVTWLGGRVGVELTLEIIFSYVFLPVSWCIGIDWEDNKLASSLLGTKIVANEILAFMDLGGYISNNQISKRSAALITYALCGFSSIGTLSIFFGVWNNFNKNKLRDVVSLFPRVLFISNLSCFMTACIAGILFNDDIISMEDGNSVKNDPLTAFILDSIPSYEQLFDSLFKE